MPRKPSLDGKDSSLRIRMSPEQKEKLVFYAERHYQTMSNVCLLYTSDAADEL